MLVWGFAIGIWENIAFPTVASSCSQYHFNSLQSLNLVSLWSSTANITHLRQRGLFYLNSLDQSTCIYNSSVSSKFLLILSFTEIPACNADSLDADQMITFCSL